MIRLFTKQQRSREEVPGENSSSPLQAKLENIIKHRQQARLRYERDKDYRSFEPYVLFRSAHDELLVQGLQLTDPAHAFTQPRMHTFKLADIQAVAATDVHFAKPPKFSSHTAEFRYGVICAVDRV